MSAAENRRSRASAPAERVARIVELFVAEPDRRFTLSQISDDLDLSISTAHSILTTLTARSWVVRRPADKSYSIGPALVGAARASRGSIAGLTDVEAAVERLSAELDDVCAASRLEGDEIVIVAQTRPIGVVDPATRAGQRVPFGAPFGSCFVAWAPPERVQAWLEGSALGISSTEAALYQHVFEGIRERGYGVERLDRARTLFHDALVEFRNETMSTALLDRIREVMPFITIREFLPEELTADTVFDVAMVHTPVFDRQGEVAFNLSVHIRRTAVPVEELNDVAKLLLEVAQHCTASMQDR